MRNRVSRAVSLAVSAAALAAAAVLPLSTAAQAAPADWPSYIVTVRPGVDPAGVAAQVGGVHPDRYFHHTLNGFAARLSPRQVADVAALPGVVAVETDGTAGPF
ncbi:protease inhibitor I9 family protein [Streptomyces polychromogenes]|nr:protease inhibitor I9 family protein [Streptomyces polychromogenes]